MTKLAENNPQRAKNISDDRVLSSAVKSDWDLRRCFEQLRFDKNHHLGLGDIRLTIAQQEEICELVERFYRCRERFRALRSGGILKNKCST